jgi:hypothetical protein
MHKLNYVLFYDLLYVKNPNKKKINIIKPNIAIDRITDGFALFFRFFTPLNLPLNS